jgi:bacteriorhodopsin
MDWNIFLLIQKPAYQALCFLLLTPILIFIIQPKSADSAWVIAAYTFVLFMIVNAGLLWVSDSPWRYFFYSIGCAVVYLLLIAILIPGILKVLKLKDSEESAMAFLILIYQPFALLLVMAVKWIVTKWF